MKRKSLLSLKSAFWVMIVFMTSASAFAQTSLSSIAYTDGLTYSYVNPIAVAGGATICIGNNATYTGTEYWDLNSYTGIDIKVTFPAEANGTVEMRLVMVGTSGAQSITKSVTATPQTSTIFSFNFATDGAQSFKLWAIKLGWGTSVTTAYNMSVDYVHAISETTGVKNPQSLGDPDRLVNVFNLTGKMVRSGVKLTEATLGLSDGIYIIENRKVSVKNQ